jgi:hypothetical protein
MSRYTSFRKGQTVVVTATGQRGTIASVIDAPKYRTAVIGVRLDDGGYRDFAPEQIRAA